MGSHKKFVGTEKEYGRLRTEEIYHPQSLASYREIGA
jgi:hypothetical protein